MPQKGEYSARNREKILICGENTVFAVNIHQNHTLLRKCCINTSKYGENMAYSELIGVNIPVEIDYLIRSNKDLDDRLVNLLKEVATANESIDLVNLFVLRYILGEVSQLDLQIALNKYRANKQSVVD
jgi:hypothetical protein